MERAHNTIESRIIEGLETLGGFGGKADRLNSYQHYLGNPGYLQQDILRYRQVTAASVKDFAAKYLQSEHRVVVQAVPGEKKLAPRTAVVAEHAGCRQAECGGRELRSRDQRRRAVAQRAAEKPRRRVRCKSRRPRRSSWRTDLTVILSQRPGLPVVTANLTVRSGSDANPLARPGLANFTAAMLTEGTATRKSLAIADEVARLGGRLTAGSSMDYTGVQAFALTKNFSGMLDLLADVVLHPSFPEEEVGRQRASRLSQLISLRMTPARSRIASCWPSLYGVEHPYGLLEIGTEASNKSISRDDIQAFWQKHFVPSNAALVVAGDISRADVQRLVESALGSWRGPRSADSHAGAATARRRPPHHRRQARSATDGTARGHDWNLAQVARLHSRRRDECGARGNGLEPHQPESSRGQGLHLRRVLAVSGSTGARDPSLLRRPCGPT